jgi:hypothetical protein
MPAVTRDRVWIVMVALFLAVIVLTFAIVYRLMDTTCDRWGDAAQVRTELRTLECYAQVSEDRWVNTENIRVDLPARAR